MPDKEVSGADTSAEAAGYWRYGNQGDEVSEEMRTRAVVESKTRMEQSYGRELGTLRFAVFENGYRILHDNADVEGTAERVEVLRRHLSQHADGESAG